MSAGDWFKVADPDEMAVDSVRMVKAGGRILALVRTTNGYGALSHACPHMKGPLAQGMVEDGRLLCPWHGRAFDPQSGECDGFDDPAEAFAVESRVDGIYVRV